MTTPTITPELAAEHRIAKTPLILVPQGEGLAAWVNFHADFARKVPAGRAAPVIDVFIVRTNHTADDDLQPNLTFLVCNQSSGQSLTLSVYRDAIQLWYITDSDGIVIHRGVANDVDTIHSIFSFGLRSKPLAKKPAAKKPARKTAAKKPAAKKPAAKKPATKKATTKKRPAAKKTAVAKKPAAKKAVAKKTVAKKKPAAKTATAKKKPAVKKPVAKAKAKAKSRKPLARRVAAKRK